MKTKRLTITKKAYDAACKASVNISNNISCSCLMFHVLQQAGVPVQAVGYESYMVTGSDGYSAAVFPFRNPKLKKSHDMMSDITRYHHRPTMPEHWLKFVGKRITMLVPE